MLRSFPSANRISWEILGVAAQEFSKNFKRSSRFWHCSSSKVTHLIHDWRIDQGTFQSQYTKSRLLLATVSISWTSYQTVPEEWQVGKFLPSPRSHQFKRLQLFLEMDWGQARTTLATPKNAFCYLYSSTTSAKGLLHGELRSELIKIDVIFVLRRNFL